MHQPESPPSASSWSSTEDGAAELSVLAVRMPLAALTATIVLIVLTFGAAAVGLLIALDVSGAPVGRWLVIVVAGSVGIAASIGLIQTMRARRRRLRIRIDSRSVSVSSEHSTWELPLAELQLVRLRRRTDYARIVFVGPKPSRLSLLGGLGIAPELGDTEAAYFPVFSAEVETRLRAAGLTERRTPRHPDLVDWVRVPKA